MSTISRLHACFPERVYLSDRIVLFPNKPLTEHGNVFEGEIISEVAHGRNCAIKFPRVVEQTSREVEALRRIGCQSRIIVLLECGTYQDLLSDHSYIALEKCDKWNLRQHLLHRKHTLPVFDVNWAWNFCRQIIEGMKFVHEKLIIHKDLKPSNILLTHDLIKIKIADFGSSQELKSTSSMIYCPNMFGTLGFRAPESFGGSYISLKSDIFSLGALFYYLLSDGESPFGVQSDLWDHHTRMGIIDVSKSKVSNPTTTEHLIKLMLSHDRRLRPSIWQVVSHPCWSGGDCNCGFGKFKYLVESIPGKSLFTNLDYGLTEEDGCDVEQESGLDADDAELDLGLRLFMDALRKWLG